MISETPNLFPEGNVIEQSENVIDKALLPDRHPQRDLFICDVADAVLKDIIQDMEHPFYSLSKKPETAIREYHHKGKWLRVIPSSRGLATIYDKDILIYAISQIMAKLKNGEKVTKRVRINSFDFLTFTNRGTGGKDYKALVESFERLRGTTISTNIVTGNVEQTNTFGLIDSASVVRKFGTDGRLVASEITLSDWVFNAIENQEVLTLHPSYFRLRKPMERRIYELARKHCGQQKKWKCGVDILYKKSGSKSRKSQFRYLLKNIAETNHLPDYSLTYIETDDAVVFLNRDTMSSHRVESLTAVPALSTETYEDARRVAPGWDVYALETEWRDWITEAPRSPDAAFIGFCKKVYEKRGRP